MATRVRLSKQQHLQICTKHEERAEWSYNELAGWAQEEFALSKKPAKSSILRILRNKETLAELSADCLSRKVLRSKHMLQLDEAVVEFIIDRELAKMPTSGLVILGMAKLFAKKLLAPANQLLLFTRTGWLRHFMERYNFKRKRAHGDIGSVDVAAARQHLQSLREQIGQFHPSDVYNMNETALFYKLTPRTSIVLHKAPALKQDKSRVTMAIGANADGSEKLPLVFLGKSEHPHWLHEKPDSVEYVRTSKGWMTVPVYQEWLVNLDERMKKANRYILLLVDNAPVHIDRGVSLTNVTIRKLPPNTTALLQPMDQGMIACLKRRYANLKNDVAVDRYLDGNEKPLQVTLLEGIKWCEESWCSILAEVMQYCWCHAGLLVDRLHTASILNE